MSLPLEGHTFECTTDEVGSTAEQLLSLLGAGRAERGIAPSLGRVVSGAWQGPRVEWALSGAMALTGASDGPPLGPDAPVCQRLRGAQAVLRLLSSQVGGGVDVDVLALLGERAALAGLTRRGSRSVGGAARLVAARDGVVAVNLARPSDIEAIPAWLELDDVRGDPWNVVAAAIAARPVADVVDRAQLVGIAVALVPEANGVVGDAQLDARGQRGFPAPWVLDQKGSATKGPRSARARPIVVDLSPLWAGPLCAHLLGLAGARIIKVETRDRPDAMRDGNPAFFDLLHAGHANVALDLASDDGRRHLRELILHADVVIEESRPRALAQMGIDVGGVMAAHPSLTWISITGYGRSGPWSNRVAFGDDAAAAAGLVVGERGTPMFCADAVADPITGVYAAIGGLASLVDGGGYLVDVPLREAAGYACGGVARPAATAARRTGGRWTVGEATGRFRVHAPRARPVRGVARSLGADTSEVLRRLELAR